MSRARLTGRAGAPARTPRPDRRPNAGAGAQVRASRGAAVPRGGGIGPGRPAAARSHEALGCPAVRRRGLYGTRPAPQHGPGTVGDGRAPVEARAADMRPTRRGTPGGWPTDAWGALSRDGGACGAVAGPRGGNPRPAVGVRCRGGVRAAGRGVAAGGAPSAGRSPAPPPGESRDRWSGCVPGGHSAGHPAGAGTPGGRPGRAGRSGPPPGRVPGRGPGQPQRRPPVQAGAVGATRARTGAPAGPAPGRPVWAGALGGRAARTARRLPGACPGVVRRRPGGPPARAPPARSSRA